MQTNLVVYLIHKNKANELHRLTLVVVLLKWTQSTSMFRDYLIDQPFKSEISSNEFMLIIGIWSLLSCAKRK